LTPVKLDKKLKTMRVSVDFEDLKKLIHNNDDSYDEIHSGVRFVINQDIFNQRSS